MRQLGHVLLWAGFLVGSLLTVFHSSREGVEYVKALTPESRAVKGLETIDLSSVEVPENGWHLIPWIWYSVAAAVCFTGVVLLHVSRRQVTQRSDQSAANLQEITQALERAIEKTQQLKQSSSNMAPSKIVIFIDDEIADELRTFADGRECMVTEQGLTFFADVMSPFAAGERAINRAWSAAADGYIDEATDCLEKGLRMLTSAREKNKTGIDEETDGQSDQHQ